MKLKKLRCTSAMLGTMIATLTACGGQKNYVLQGTILSEAIIVTVDGEPTIVDREPTILTCVESDETHEHYRSIINGERLTDYPTCQNIEVRKVNEIEIIGMIDAKLTKDELEKAANGNLNSEDIIGIIDRIQKEYGKESENKDKQKTIN